MRYTVKICGKNCFTRISTNRENLVQDIVKKYIHQGPLLIVTDHEKKERKYFNLFE